MFVDRAGSVSTFDTPSFRAAVAFVTEALVAVGLVQTSDTGQMDPATVNDPGSGAYTTSYQIWRFSDPAQATDPIYFKLHYGHGNSSMLMFRISQMGTGSNGAGTITGNGVFSNAGNINFGPGSINYTRLYVSFKDGAFVLVMSGTTMAPNDAPLVWVIERLRKPDGSLVPGNFLVWMSQWSTSPGQNDSQRLRQYVNGAWNNDSTGLEISPPVGNEAGVIGVGGFRPMNVPRDQLQSVMLAPDGVLGMGERLKIPRAIGPRTYKRFEHPVAFQGTGYNNMTNAASTYGNLLVINE